MSCCRRNQESGITVQELLVGITLTAVVLQGALFAAGDLRSSFARYSARTAVEALLFRARALAVERGATLVALPLASGTGLRLIAAERRSSSSEELLRQEFSQGVTLDSPPVQFNSRGISVDEQGLQTEAVLILNQNGKPFCRGTLHPFGAIVFDC